MAIRRNKKVADNKFVKIQTRKAISSYGGSGSIIETPFGALMIDNFDEWPFFYFNKKDGQTLIDASYHVNDERLLQRLSHKDVVNILSIVLSVNGVMLNGSTHL